MDVDAIDQELLRRGVRPDVIAKLAGSQPSANSGTPLVSFARPLGQPDAAGWRRPVDVAAEAAASKPTPPVSFMGPKPEPTAPDLQPMPPAGSPLSFVQPGQPAKPASIISNLTPAVSFLSNSAAQPSRDPHTASRLQPGDLDRYLSPTNPAGTQGAPPVSFLGSQNPQAGPQDAAAATASTGVSNASALMRVASQSNGAGGTQPRPIEEEYRELLQDEPTRAQFPAQKMPVWKKLLGGALSVAAGAGGGGEVAGDVANRFFTSPQRKAEGQFEQAHQGWEGKVGNLLKAAKLRHDDLEDRNLQSEIDNRDKDKPDDPRDKKIDEGYNREGQRVHVYQRQNGSEYTKVIPEIVQKQGPTEHKTPFEAYAYGTPDEKQSAQDFLDMEHKFQHKYSNPSEFDERYKLFKEDPDTYRAMFGDKSGSGPDAANATRMLAYFDRRRREVQGDFTLDDSQKQEQLQEIEKLEKPFMDAAQPGNRRGGNEDRVTVTHPDGRSGTIPRSRLEAAKKKGYREAQPR